MIEATGLERDAVKLKFLRDVLAKKGRYPSEVEAAFGRAFPNVYRVIRQVNRHDHGELIRLLQRAESWLVIEQVAPRRLETPKTLPASCWADTWRIADARIAAGASAAAETIKES